MPLTHYLILAALLPLAGFGLLIFFGKKFSRLAGPLATLLIFGSFALSITALVLWIGRPEFNKEHYHDVETLTYRWMPLPAEPAPEVLTDPNLAPLSPTPIAASPSPAITIGILVDSLTVVMFVMVTLVAAMVHLFSISYMAHDPRISRYFAYLGLFTFSMLGLLLANSLIQLFIFWELVGICSYLLIGFWFEKRGPAIASLKAVIVNRIGDVCFLIGIGILFMHVGASGLTFCDSQGTSVLGHAVGNALDVRSSEFLRLTSTGGFLNLHWLTWVGLCLFGGAAAKSAQFPLHVWLPDAMEGPTPVSALIHAATMVAAGVYLVARIYPILTLDARLVIAVIGCVTLAIGALIALVQTDIKKVLAYSTISQLGFMMLFLGCGGYVAGLLHLFTHAFFKACLFLGAGSVIHALQNQQDLKHMGGLWKKLPITALTFLIATLAISGVPWFSGYYSKELGLSCVFEYAQALSTSATHPHYAMLLFWIPALTSYVTAFYMGRLWWLIFAGKNRNEDLLEQAHESTFLTLPLIVLAGLSLGIWFAPSANGDFFGLSSLLTKSLTPDALTIRPAEDLLEHMTNYIGKFSLYAPAILGLTAALAIYFTGFSLAARIRRLPVINLLYLWLREKMFFDALYNGIFVRAALTLSAVTGFLDKYLLDGLVNLTAFLTRALARLSNLIDNNLIDGMVNGLATTASLSAHTLLAPQAGRIRIYLLLTLSALALTTLLILFSLFH